MSARTILVTGATGFVGAAVVADLARRDDAAQLVLWARAANEPEARGRLRLSLQRFLGAGAAEGVVARARIVVGDLSDRAALAAGSLAEVTHVLHAAGNTSFAARRTARSSNVLGALALAHRLRVVPGLVRYLHVSTAYCVGTRPARIVHEGDAPDARHHHLFEYTRSKAEAELLLAATAPELPLVVARPSTIVGHTRLGCAPSASIFWYFRALAMLGVAPFAPEQRKDIVPVDWVAEALVTLLFAPSLGERVYHVSAGAASEPWQEIAAAWARLDASVQARPRACRPEDLAEQVPRFAELWGPGDDRRLLRALTAFARFGALGVDAFDNRRLLDEGVPPAPRFTDYLERCIREPPGRSLRDQLADD